MKTLQLTQVERSDIDAIIKTFKDHYNTRSRAIKTEDLLFHLKATGKLSVTGQTFRKYLGLIRKDDLASPAFIVSHVNLGYWCTDDKAEMNDYLQQELNRMSNQFANVEALRQRLILNKPKVESQQILMFNG